MIFRIEILNDFDELVMNEMKFVPQYYRPPELQSDGQKLDRFKHPTIPDDFAPERGGHSQDVTRGKRAAGRIAPPPDDFAPTTGTVISIAGDASCQYSMPATRSRVVGVGMFEGPQERFGKRHNHTQRLARFDTAVVPRRVCYYVSTTTTSGKGGGDLINQLTGGLNR